MAPGVHAGPAGPAAGSSRGSCRFLQGRGPGGAMREAAFDVGQVVEPVPEHFPARLFDAAVAFGEIERVGRIAAARAPEQAGRLRAHHLPDSAHEDFALRIVEDGALVQVDAFVLAGENTRNNTRLTSSH